VSGVRIPDGSPENEILKTLERQGFSGFFVAGKACFSGKWKGIKQHEIAWFDRKKPVKFLSKWPASEGGDGPGDGVYLFKM